ncbi:hypothetical protein [Croceicoccus mobilis]|uniref:Uncharacterized protein n=1 Tax=Croceicoccus mobilis TaxID=1703339 RepID=A0A916Z1T1_9SPHN|nr:hypothetical protein [Croceicoccus mobilis]GGD71872.1 hypothetical protein GCM10010990_21670 [Croceicoccus mobilis]
MKKILTLAAVAAPALLLAACGSTESADAPAEADNVEMPAAEVMAQPGMEEDSAVEPEAADAAMAEPAEPAPVTDTTAEEAADEADDAAADLSAAMAE